MYSGTLPLSHSKFHLLDPDLSYIYIALWSCYEQMDSSRQIDEELKVVKRIRSVRDCARRLMMLTIRSLNVGSKEHVQ